MSAFKQLGPILLPQAETGVDTQPRKQTNLSETGFLSSGSVDVERVTNNAPTLTLSGRFRPPLVPRDRVPLLADEFDSLIAGDIGPLGLFDQDDANGRLSGYYEIEEGTAEPTHPERPTIQDWSLTLRRVGNRSNLFRAVTTTETGISNPFAVTSPPTPGVQLPPESRETRWFDPATGSIESAGASGTVATPDGALPVFSPSSASFGDPVLLYDVPLAADVGAARVFNSRGQADKFDSNGVRQWRAVYDPEFQPPAADEGIYLTNRRLRILAAGPPNGGISAEEWDPTSQSFDSVLQTQTWVPQSIDLVDLGLHQITVDLRMSDGSTTHPTRFRLPYGAGSVRITSAPSATGSFPSGLKSTLDPIAYEGDNILQPSRGVVPKRTVRT
jgi:hypothetical protein